MSRLPRLHSSSDRHQPAPTLSSSSRTMSSSLKRKAAFDDEGPDNNYPRKLPAISENNQPLRPSKTAPNVPSRIQTRRGPLLTIPKAPALATTTARRVTRATSAPPKREPVRPPVRPAPGTRAPINRVASGSRTATGGPRLRGAGDDRFQALQDQVTSIEYARAVDAARLAADMESERAKLSELQANHNALSRELAVAKSQEMNQRQELSNASDELEQMKRRHANELMDMDMDMKKKERMIRELKDDLRMCQSDLERERETVTTLKSTLSHQSTTQLTLSTQVTALRAQLSALQATLDVTSNSGTQLQMQLETERRRVAELEQETRQAETIRRKLHNMVQELKVCASLMIMITIPSYRAG